MHKLGNQLIDLTGLIQAVAGCWRCSVGTRSRPHFLYLGSERRSVAVEEAGERHRRPGLLVSVRLGLLRRRIVVHISHGEQRLLRSREINENIRWKPGPEKNLGFKEKVFRFLGFF